MPQTISTYYGDQKAIWEENATNAITTFDVGAIHKMRTTTKRLRTLFPFLGMLSEGSFKGKDILAAFKGFYQQSGRIRELQIEQFLITEYENKLGSTFKDYLDYLAKREQYEIRRFARLNNSSKSSGMLLPLVGEIEMLERGQAEILIENTQQFFLKKMGKILRLINKRISNRRIHSVRKHVKRLYYSHDFLDTKSIILPPKMLSQAQLREIEQYIGNWHDLVNSQRFMYAWSRTKYFIGSDSFTDLRNQISLERFEMRRHIIREIFPELNRSFKI